MLFRSGLRFLWSHSSTADWHSYDGNRWFLSGSPAGNSYIRHNGTYMGIGSAVTRATTMTIMTMHTLANLSSNRFAWDRGNTGRSWVGYIAEMIVSSESLNDYHTLNIINYLANKYALTVSYTPL